MPTKTTTKKSTFDVLNAINVNDRTEKKGHLTYLSWSWAWQEVKKTFPDATYTYYTNPETNLPFSFKEGVGAFCHTSVTIKDETLEMWLPVMDNRNQSVLKPTSTQINSTLMRCLTKNLAMHGMGLYIYAGEDIPQITAEEISKSNEQSKSKKVIVTDDNWAKIVETSKRLQSQKVKWDTILARLMDKYIVDIPQIEKLKKNSMENKEIIEKLRDDQEYYGDFGKQYISNSDIKVLRDNPEAYRLPVESNENLEKGRLFHQLILEPDKAKDFPIADFTRRDKSYKEWCAEKGLSFALKTSEADEIKALVDWFMNEDNKKVKAMKEYLFDFDAKYEEPMIGDIMGSGHIFKGKADIISKEMIIDLKTSGDVAKWTRNAPYYGYDTQAYIYQKLFGMPMVFFVVGKTPKPIGTRPGETTYDVGVFGIKPETLSYAKEKVEHALLHYDKYFSENATGSIEEIIYKGDF